MGCIRLRGLSILGAGDTIMMRPRRVKHNDTETGDSQLRQRAILLSNEDWAALKKMADLDGLKISQLIRQILRRHIQRQASTLFDRGDNGDSPE